MKKQTVGFILAVFVAIQAHAANGPAGAPKITFSGNTVQVSGVTPGGIVVIYGVAMLRVDYSNALIRFSKALTDDDHDGVVTYDIGRTIPPSGVWIAVDVTNGQFAVAAPWRTLPAAHALAQPFRRNAAGLVDTFSHDYATAEMLYIHPGGGVWVVSAVDNGRNDRDPRPGVTGISIGDAVSLMPQGGAKLSEFVPGGVLIAFDVSRFEVLTLRITGEDLRGAR